MDVHVIGYALHPPAEAYVHKRLEEMVFDTARAALDAAAIARHDLQGVTIAGSDELDGRSISGMLLAAPAGAVLRDEIKCADSGLHALLLGAARVAAGAADPCLVVSWSKTSEAPVENVMRMRCEPFFTRPVGLNMAISDALFAHAASAALGFDEEDATRCAFDAQVRARGARRRDDAGLPDLAGISASPYVATPLREGHRAPLSDGAAGFVLVSGDWLMRRPHVRPLARIAGTGWRSDAYELGKTRLTSMAAFRGAIGEALTRAGVDDAGGLASIELDSPTSYHELAYRSVLTEADPAAISPGGGCFSEHPYFCMGLVNAAGALDRARKGGAGARTAAHECHGFAQQSHAAVVFEGV